ncbi:MAG: hypothetical protein GY723_21225, partial [bacterium]|nr:hypothetical protein [bacterium]
LVENAVKYAVEPDRRGGRIVIECRRRDASCEIRITDSGDGFDPEAAIEGFGIGGVRQRLELNYPGAHRFEFTCTQGCTLTIEIPIC